MTERSTFSPFWHRVRAMKPRLRPHVQITRQHYRGRRWHVVHDPTSNQFYRLNPIAHDFVSTLDGSRDVESAWKLSLSKFGDSAPTQNEIIQLLSQLYSSNLLSADATPETEQLLRRGRERLKKRIAQQAIGIMYFKIRLINPDRILTLLEPIFRPLISRWGLLAWACLVLFALTRVIPHWDVLVGQFDKTMSPSNWGWLAVVFVVTKLIHETGHGLICKRFGGQVPELGAMMLVLFPAPYVDASARWASPRTWRRMAVGAGGMIFELTVASLCAIYWSSAKGAGEGALPVQLAYNAMLTASVSTVLFNANPLMRFDGYYILSDLLEVPNLMQRSQRMLQYLLQRFVFRLPRLTPPSNVRSEQVILTLYGIGSGIYRIFLFLSITMYVMGKFFAIGIILAAWTAAAWFLIPVGKLVHWLASSPQLHEKRGRVILATLGLAALVTAGVGAIPVPDYRRAWGVIESEHRVGVFYETDGFVAHAHVRPGDKVHAGDAVVTLTSPELEVQREGLLARIEELGVDERAGRQKNDPKIVMVTARQIEILREKLADIDDRISKLVVRAPQDGTVVGGDPERVLGAYVKRGDRVCEIVDEGTLRIAAVLDNRDGAWITANNYKVRLHSISYREDEHGAADRVIEGGRVRPQPSGQQILPNPALGFQGGGKIETDPRDEQGRMAKKHYYTVYIEPAGDAEWVGPPGERVKVRFRLPSQPLLGQWVDRLWWTIQDKVKNI
jgi:putative peptide zinc metalloprotease protein